MPQTSTDLRRLRVQPAPDGAVRDAVLCPICQQRMALVVLLRDHLNDHQYGRFGAESTGPIAAEVTLVVGKADNAAPVA